MIDVIKLFYNFLKLNEFNNTNYLQLDFQIRDVQHNMYSCKICSSVPHMQSLLNEDNLHQVELEKLLLNDKCKLVNCDQS